MAKRDTYITKLLCPVCGHEGVANLSEKDGAEYLRDMSTSVDHCPEGFGYHAPAKASDLPSFYCIKHPDSVAG
jgi:hypothetical protein